MDCIPVLSGNVNLPPSEPTVTWHQLGASACSQPSSLEFANAEPSRASRRQFLASLGLLTGAASLPALAATEKTPLETTDIPSWSWTTDVLVLGSGAAGISAALEARAAGAEVLVLERFERMAGSSGMSGGVCYLGGGTPLQKALGFEDSAEDMYNYIVAAGSLYPPLDKIQPYCEQSVEHFDWLVKQGVSYKTSFADVKGLPATDDSLYYSGNEQAHPYRDLAKPVPRGHVPGYPGWLGGQRLMQSLLKSALTSGAKVVTEARGLQLITEAGRIVGMLVEHRGEKIAVRARRGVVLAAGGFIHNREMVKDHAPELFKGSVPWANGGDMGDGIRMGMTAGGEAVRMNQGFAILPLYQPDVVLKGIVVNATGQRYIAEDVYHAFLGHATAYCQQGQAYLITDEQSQYGYDDYRVVEVAKADTIEQLEQQLQLPVGSLRHTLSYYNQYAQKRKDPLFHKQAKYLQPLSQAPFRAYDLNVERAFYATHTFGGLKTNPYGQVFHISGELIEGLYAVGRTSAGLPTAPYIASGISVGDCTFFGRRAGRHAAKA